MSVGFRSQNRVPNFPLSHSRTVSIFRPATRFQSEILTSSPIACSLQQSTASNFCDIRSSLRLPLNSPGHDRGIEVLFESVQRTSAVTIEFRYEPAWPLGSDIVRPE